MSVNIDGTNGITVNGTKVATAIPAVRVSNGSLQNYSSGTWTKVFLTSELFDTNNAFDAGSTYRFQPAVAGYYQVQSNIIFSSATVSISFVSSYVYKNGTTAYNGTYFSGLVTSSANASVTDLIYLNGTTDYLELYGYCAGSSPYVNTNNATFSAYLVRPA